MNTSRSQVNNAPVAPITMMLQTASVEMPSALVLHMLPPLSEMKMITSDSICRKKETQHAFKKKRSSLNEG
jgi:hypothetical protein